MAFDGVIPITDVAGSAWAEVEVDGDKGKIGREDEVELKFLREVIIFFSPRVKFDFVGGFVAGFDETALHFVGPEVVGNKILSANSRVGLHAIGSGMLCGISEVGGVEGRGEDGVRGDMVAPRVKCDAPRICVGIGSKGSEFFVRRMVEKPGRVLGANRSVGGFNLAVVEDGFAEEEITAGSPGEVVKGMVGVLTAESGEEDLAVIHFPVAITIGEVGQVRFFRAINAAISIEDERERDVKVIGPSGAFISFSILVCVFEDNDFIAGLLTGIDVRISHGG